MASGGGVFAADALDALKGGLRLPPGTETPARLKGWWGANRGKIRRDAASGLFYVSG